MVMGGREYVALWSFGTLYGSATGVVALMTITNDASRRDFIRSCTAATAATVVGRGLVWGAADSEDRERPNLLFIMADDHAAHALGCYGSRINATPNLDRIAREGMRFENCFCTNSICAPSRAVILTGKYSHLNGVLDNRKPFDGSQVTFPKLLQEAGYHTAMIGKWHLQSPPTGFDYWNVLPGQGRYHNPEMIEMGEKKELQGYVTDMITDLSLKFIRNRPKGKPFCLLYQHKAPHMPWEPDEKHATMYDETVFAEPVTFNDDYESRASAVREQELSVEHHLNNWMKWDVPANLSGQARKDWLYQQYMKVYLASVASIDDNVGRVLDYLDEAGLADNTIVVYTSDQGFFLGDHGLFDKRFMYEEALRMPLLIQYPREIEAGAVNTDMVLNLDFAPTFLDFAGISMPSEMQGRCLRPILAGETPPDWRTSMYYRYYEEWLVKPHYGVRTERYKLIHFQDGVDEWELFDLRDDPRELKNVYHEPGRAEVVESLKAELRRLREYYGDATP